MSRCRRFHVSFTVTVLLGCSFPHFEFRGEPIDAESGGGASGSGTSGAYLTSPSSSGFEASGGALNLGGTGVGSGGHTGTETVTFAGAGVSGGQTTAPEGGMSSTTDVTRQLGGQGVDQAGATAGGETGSIDSSGGQGGTPLNNGAGTGNVAPVAESCGNGVDDDLDGKTDCEDTDCPDSKCQDAVPDGWSGPVVTVTATNMSDLPSCDAAGTYTSALTLGCSQTSPNPAQCPPCPECPLATDVTGVLSMTAWGASCHASYATQNPADSLLTRPIGCSNIHIEKSKLTRGLGVVNLTIDQVTYSSGKCEPNSTHHEREAATDASCLQYTRICRGPTSAGSCRSGTGVCMPNSTPRFGSLCIYAQGIQTSCPEGWGGIPQVVEVGAIDNRTCANCTCSPPAAVNGTAATLQNWGSNLSCSVSGFEGSAKLGSCLPASDFDTYGNFDLWMAAPDAISPTLRCLPGGGGPAGSISPPQTEYTVCCN